MSGPPGKEGNMGQPGPMGAPGSRGSSGDIGAAVIIFVTDERMSIMWPDQTVLSKYQLIVINLTGCVVGVVITLA